MALDQGLFIALLNPSLSAVLSAAFFVLWTVRRQAGYVLQLCLCYCLVAIGFVLQGFQLGLGFELSKLVSNLLFFTAVFLFVSAVVSRQKLPVPRAALLVCAAAGMSAFTWFLFVVPDFGARVFAVNYALGAMCAVGVFRLRQSTSVAPADRLLTWLAGLRALDFFIRPAVVALLDGGGAGDASFVGSSYWLTTSLSVVVWSLMIALTLLTAVGFDIIQEFRTESHTDALSGLLNRRGFHDRTRAFFDLPAGSKVPVGLVLADLDHFKAVNDRHGHAAGDAVITAFARLLRQTGSDKAIIGRTGGEEFAVFMPHCDLGAARLFAEGVRAALGSGALEGTVPGLGPVTCSFGVAARSGGESLDALFKRADDALMQAKRAGRDRVRVTYVRSETDLEADAAGMLRGA
ncbi:GGDEF domain-containing protein [Mesorhizobium sp. LHD-90]|uniref:GGDEF domain-containing protein n=1 Tax=Mesorhizobium sp. LHD-90 TaxID=3071414 RepID=UPI0027E117E5|nr:GGDEF domain-containing protein [Mesorhizobium sp. LHD-90]MDQ6434049.1 GGDEF domain-containing protein [Mesorhizobium sp. LHD-90]